MSINGVIEIMSGERFLSLAEIEVEAIRLAIESCGGNVSAAAMRLGIGRSTIYRKLSERSGIKPKEDKAHDAGV